MIILYGTNTVSEDIEWFSTSKSTELFIDMHLSLPVC